MTLLPMLARPAFAQDVGRELANAAATSALYLVMGLVVALGLAGGLLLYARRSTQRAQEELENASRPLEERSPLLAAQLSRPRRSVDMDALVGAVPRFSLARFRDWAQALHSKVHAARPTRDGSEVDDLVRPGALEMAFHGPPGLETVGRIRYVQTRLLRTTVATTGCQLKLKITALITETREGKRTTWETEEVWSFSREDGTWQVLHIEREGRFPLLKPTPSWDKPFVEDMESRRDPEVLKQKEQFAEAYPDHDWSTFEAGVRQAFARVQAAITHQQPEAVTNLLSPLALSELQVWMRRYHKHGLARKRTEPTVAHIDICRVTRDAEHERITCRLTGSVIDVVEDGDGTLLGEQRTTPMRFSAYWTFVRKPAGQWRLDFMDDDLTWVV